MKFKHKLNITRFSCLFTSVMVLAFTVISPYIVSAGSYYPQYSIPMTWNKAQTELDFFVVEGTVNGDPSSGTYVEKSYTGSTWFTDTTNSQRYGSYWNDNEVFLRWYLGRMVNATIAMDNGWDYAPPKMDPNTHYRWRYNFDLDLHNYFKDGTVTLNVILWWYIPSRQEYESEVVFSEVILNNSGYRSQYFNSEGHFIYDNYFYDVSVDRIPEVVTLALTWSSWTSSNQGGAVSFRSAYNYIEPYYENSGEAPVYPDYDDGSLDDYNAVEEQVNDFVSGNLDNVTDMIGNGFRYLTGSFKNTMLYCGNVLTTLSNNDFLSILIPISLSLGFISFLLVGGGLISKSIGKSSGKKGG